MYIFPYYCAYCDNEITEIVVRTATVVRLSCNSCHTKYYQCHYCNTGESRHTKYHILNTNHLSRKILCIKSEPFKKYTTQKECQEQKDT